MQVQLSHGSEVKSSYLVPLTVHNPSDVGQKARLTTVECKGENEAEFRVVKDVTIHRQIGGQMLSLKPAEYYFDLDPKETQNCELFLPPYTRTIGVPNVYGISVTGAETCASVHFRITATNLGTGEAVMLCGENKAPEETLPDWAAEAQEVRPPYRFARNGLGECTVAGCDNIHVPDSEQRTSFADGPPFLCAGCAAAGATPDPQKDADLRGAYARKAREAEERIRREHEAVTKCMCGHTHCSNLYHHDDASCGERMALDTSPYYGGVSGPFRPGQEQVRGCCKCFTARAWYHPNIPADAQAFEGWSCREVDS